VSRRQEFLALQQVVKTVTAGIKTVEPKALPNALNLFKVV
jgi:hypothetical protein